MLTAPADTRIRYRKMVNQSNDRNTEMFASVCFDSTAYDCI